MKKKNRIGRELISVLLLFFSVIIALLLIGSYFTHSREVDGLYKGMVEQVSVTVADALDGDFLHQLSDVASSDEYQALRTRAAKEDNVQILRDYLEENGLYADYDRCTKLLASLQKNLSVEYLDVQDLGGNDAVSLLNPDEGILFLGMPADRGEAFDLQSENARIPASVKRTDSGWLCTCTEPVASSDGSFSAVINVEQNMNAVISERLRFALIMCLISAGILVIMAFACGFYIRKVVSDPLSELAHETSRFGVGDREALESQVISVPERKNDEIRDLYETIRQMQLGIIAYMNNLTIVTEERQRMGTELDIANRIQASMLPSTFPAFPDRDEFDVYALMKPAKSVAGDFYDFFLIDDDHLGIIMADVSGKGIPASLFMMMSKIIITNIAQLGIPPHEVLEMANERICENNEADMFVTTWFGILTISTGHVVAANAGHEYPVVQNENGVYEYLHDKHGFVLGGMEGLKYKDYEFDLKKGQTLFLYTDGVPEATTEWNEQFGPDRLIKALNKKQGANPQELVHYMLRTVDDFDGDVPQFDDITMLAIRYKGSKMP